MDTAHFDQMKAERDEARRMAQAIRAEAGWKETWPFPWEQVRSKNIIVNGEPLTTGKDVLSYGEVLELAYPGIEDPSGTVMSVTVGHRDGRASCLAPGQSTRVADGSVFSAYYTGNA
jgi:hypothetical protein